MFGYIVTELCECNLDTFVSQLRKSGAVNQRLAMSVARDMLEGVHYLHQRGIRLGRLKVTNAHTIHDFIRFSKNWGIISFLIYVTTDLICD